MDVFVYFALGLSVPRDEIEDAIEECLGDRGEVTGGGAGIGGSNIDIEVFNDDALVVADIRNVLLGLGLPSSTTLVVDGERSTLG